MKYVSEFRDNGLVQKLLENIHKKSNREWVIMEVCGGQTHSIVRYGLQDLLKGAVELVHGPGCPVCVTSLELLDKAHTIAKKSDVIFCSYGDMLRVPGSNGDFLSLKARGHDIRVVYSPLDAVKIAKDNPTKEIVFFAIGFETTAPANAMSVVQAKKQNINNFSILTSHVLVPPAMKSILQSSQNRVQAFLGPGHVCAVVGMKEYYSIADIYKVPIVISGFEPVDLLTGIEMCIDQLEKGQYIVENQYDRLVLSEGNINSKKFLQNVFEICDRKWRGIGIIPKSGYKLSYEYKDYDAEIKFAVEAQSTCESPHCISGEVLKGLKKPRECPAFGKLCSPDNPLGATMVSNEGACAAYFNYVREYNHGP